MAAPSGKSEQKGKAGRPPGSRTQDYDVTTTEVKPCKICGSITREPYKRVTRTECPGVRKVLVDGAIVEAAYRTIVRRYTRCADCQRNRIDIYFE